MSSKENLAPETKSSSFQRIATLDGCRGVAIFLMTFFHSTYHVVNYNTIAEDPNRLLEYPKIVLGMLGFFLYLGTWNTFFLLVSSILPVLTTEMFLRLSLLDSYQPQCPSNFPEQENPLPAQGSSPVSERAPAVPARRTQRNLGARRQRSRVGGRRCGRGATR